MTPKTARKSIAGCLLSLIVASLVWLAVQAHRSEPLAESSPLPRLSYRDASGNGAHTVGADRTHRTAIVLFNSQCEHCLYVLDAFEHRLSEVDGARLYFLTSEAALPSAVIAKRWPALVTSRWVSWGTVRAQDVRSGLRTAVTPVVFVFDEKGRLLKQFRGETKFDLLVRALTGHAAGGFDWRGVRQAASAARTDSITEACDRDVGLDHGGCNEVSR